MIEKAILEAVAKYNIIKSGQTVTVALSGGADSMALLNALVRLKDKLNITPKAAHLNHLIRGEEAFRDEEFVRKQCAKLQVELICERADIPLIAKKTSQSLELAARNVRYDFLRRINTGIVATAHTASDNIETVLLNLTRGTSIDGLCGIPIKRDIFIRPLLFCTRDMVEEYCAKNRIPFVTDSTNLSDDYSRNKLRHMVVPALKELNPSVEKSVLRSSLSLREISDDLKARAQAFLSENSKGSVLKLKDFKNLEPSLAKRVVVEFVKRHDDGISLEGCHIEEIYNICLNSGKTSIPRDNICISQGEKLYIRNSDESPEKKEYSVTICEKNFEKKQKINNLLLNNSLDCDKIIGKLVIRTRQPGDTIRLRGRGCTKPLTKLYNECGIPAEERDLLPLISDDKGVVWIHGIGVAERCAVKDTTKRFYSVEVKIKEQ
ncbi:MAG: tRNA lysidine(34) synthetase TilS [Acutalibacteraceae bacterium]|jgi:tRNA(Ile)-lysidine synthase